MTVLELVERERRDMRRLEIGAGAALLLGACAAILAASALVLGHARWLALPRPAPLVAWVLVAAAAFAAWRLTVRALHARGSRAGIAKVIEQEGAMRAGALRGALEVADQGALGRLAAERMGTALSARGPVLAPLARRSALRRVSIAGGCAALALAMLGWAAPTHPDGWRAVLMPNRAWAGTLLPSLSFRALPLDVVRGESLAVVIEAPGRTRVLLHFRATGEGWRDTTLSVSAAGSARAWVGPLRSELSLVADDGRSRTDTARVSVADRPFIGGVTLHATYPAYLARPAEDLDAGETLRLPRGTVLAIGGRASTVLARVSLASGADTVTLASADRSFSLRWMPQRSGDWRWVALGRSGPIADVPPALGIEIVPDSAPTIEIVEPRGDTILLEGPALGLRIQAGDDHGLSRVHLEVRRSSAQKGRADASSVIAVASQLPPVWAGIATLDVSALGAAAGDVIHARAVATDDSPWAQRGESREVLLKVPTLEERREIARDAADSAVHDAKAAAQAQKALEQRTDEAARQRGDRENGAKPGDPANPGNKPDDDKAMSYAGAEKAREVAKDQRALTDKVDKLRESAQSLEQQLKQAGALDSSLAKQLQDVQQLLKDAMTPQLLEQMKKLENAAQKLDRDAAKAALQDLQEMQRKLREQLEKSAEMLKRAAYEGAMQTMTDEARDIAKAQDAAADSAAQGKPDASKASELAQRSQKLSDDAGKLGDRLRRDNAESAAKGANDAGNAAQESQQKMQDAAKAMKQGGKGGEKEAREAATQMEKAAQDMQQARDGQVKEWKQELTQELDRAVQELLQMARQESAIEQKLRDGKSDAGEARGEQGAVKQGVDQTAQRLQQEARKSSLLSQKAQRAMAEAQQKSEQAAESMSGQPRPSQQTANAAGEAADALNKAAAALARDRERANSATSASGFSEMLQQLQEMAKKQGSLNAQAQGIFQMPGGEQGGAQAQATARMLARQQRSVAQQLEELGDGAGGDKAAQLAREARQVADALDRGRVDAGTVARQQQLFHKMLDAGRSLEKEERDDQGKREATSATTTERFTPNDGTASGKAASKFREPTWDELRGLSADERRVILEYFKRINGGTGAQGAGGSGKP
ncbi:MAG: hypothetical protein JWO05_2936 [Gemmatimonadetes bacterium]|nr:hypothetical protein [Gemmatimonadota bacterium]